MKTIKGPDELRRDKIPELEEMEKVFNMSNGAEELDETLKGSIEDTFNHMVSLRRLLEKKQSSSTLSTLEEKLQRLIFPDVLRILTDLRARYLYEEVGLRSPYDAPRLSEEDDEDEPELEYVEDEHPVVDDEYTDDEDDGKGEEDEVGEIIIEKDARGRTIITPEIIEEMKRRHTQGYSVKEIAKGLELGESTVYMHYKS